MDEKAKIKLVLQATTACLTNDGGCIHDGAVKGWDNTIVEIFWEVKFVKTGKVDIIAKIANDKANAGAEIEAELDEQKVSAITKFSGGWDKFAPLHLGTISITKPGLLIVKIRAKKIKGVYAGDMCCVKLKGPAVKGAEENAIPCRADSIHLNYEDGGGCCFYYNQMKVVSSFPGTFFMACGFSRGYFGIQEQDFEGKKVVIYSVWDDGCDDEDDPDKVAGEKRTYPVCCGENVLLKRFGNEGTGCQSFYDYNWNLNETYHFLVKAAYKDESMTYSGYFYLNETKEWKHIATYGVRCNIENMTGLYCFVEDYIGSYGRNIREAVYGPGWRQMLSGEWVELTKATFTQAGTLPNTDAGVINDNFMYLKTGGKIIQTNPVNSEITTKPTGLFPTILKDVDKL